MAKYDLKTIPDELLAFYKTIIEKRSNELFSKKYTFVFGEKCKDSIRYSIATRIHSFFESSIKKKIEDIIIDSNPFYFLSKINTKDELFVNTYLKISHDIYTNGLSYFGELKNNLEEYSNELCEGFFNYMDLLFSNINVDKRDIEDKFFSRKNISIINDISIDGKPTYADYSLTCIIDTNAGKFLYKPRDCKIDIWFKKLSENYFSDIYYVPNVLSYQNHSYCEFIYNKPASTNEECKKYYYNFGGICAIMCLFFGNDFTYLNIFAKKNVPVLIDIETLLRPRYQIVEDYNLSFLDGSVLGLHILPNNRRYGMFKNNDNPLMSKDDRNIAMPCINGVKKDVMEYFDYFLDGYKNLYNYILNNKNEIIKDIENSSGFNTRLILRLPYIYYGNMYRFLDLKYIADKNEKQSLINKLIGLFSGKYRSDNVAKKEVECLSKNQLPYFYGDIESRDVCSAGEILEKDFFSLSPKDNCLDRFKHFDNDDLEFELKLIKDSFENDELINISIDFNNLSFDKKYSLFNIIKKHVIKAYNDKYIWINIIVDNSDGYIFDVIKASRKIAEFCHNFAKELSGDDQLSALDLANNALNIEIKI